MSVYRTIGPLVKKKSFATSRGINNDQFSYTVNVELVHVLKII